MNIEKLARHLKEFTIVEIEMIAECNCNTELEHLLNENKLVFEQGLYKYKEPEHLKLLIFLKNRFIKAVNGFCLRIWQLCI